MSENVNIEYVATLSAYKIVSEFDQEIPQSSDGPMIDYSRKSVGLGFRLRQSIVNVLQLIVMGF